MSETGMITHILELDLYTTTSYPVVKAQQYDYQTRYLKIVLKDHEEAYEIPSGATVTLEGVRPSDNQSLSSVFVIEDDISARTSDTVLFDITQALFNEGIVEAKVIIRWGTDDKLSSIPLYIEVYKLASEGIPPTVEEKSILDNMTDHMSTIEIHRSIIYAADEPTTQIDGDLWLQEYS